MKKIFYGIGILLTVFTIYFSLLCADKNIYVSDANTYDIMISESINGVELEQYAKENDVMVQLLTHHNISFGTTDIEITLIHPEQNIRAGKQDSVFPQYNIVYVTEPDLSDIIVEYMTIQTDEAEKIDAFCNTLRENGFDCYSIETGSTRFSINMLFSELNLKFFSLLFLLSVLFITMYYIHRLKEMGILRLNGWSAFRISTKILMPMSANTIGISVIPMIIFLIYVYIMDKSFVSTCLKIYGLNILFLIAVFAVATLAATVFIKNMNQVNAIKNGRNNRFIFYSLVVVKLIVIFLVFSEICEIRDGIVELYDTKQSAQNIAERDLYYITTSNCNEEDEKKITAILSEFSNEEIFNFGISILNTYSASGVKKEAKRQMIEEDNYNVMYISDNVISELGVRDIEGNLLDNMNLKENEVYYLIPQWMQEHIEEIKEYISIDEMDHVIYIKNDQTYSHLFWPGTYIYDCIIQVHSPDKSLFPEYSETVLLTKQAAETFNQKVEEAGLSGYIVSAGSSEMDSDLSISNAELELWEAVFDFVIILLAYIITSVSIILIYFEFKKKLFSVYVLFGRIPLRSLAYFAIINGVIVGIGAVATDMGLLMFIFFEWLFYGAMAYRYLRKKAIYVLKGE